MSRSSSNKGVVQLHVEVLEFRWTPDANSYVNGLYAQVLHRAPSQGDLTYWAGQVQNSGMQKVAEAFWLSAEHRGLEVDSYYQNYLGRTESAADRQFWVNRFTNGGLSEVQMQLAFLTSAEFLNKHSGATNYVQALYQDVLGRAPDTGGQTYWTQQLQNGQSTANVALGFLSSQEGQGRYVDSLYSTLLNRASDPNGRAYWVAKLNDNDPGDTDDFNSYTQSTDNDSDNSQYFDNLDNFNDSFQNSNEASREGLAVNFLTSTEFANSH